MSSIKLEVPGDEDTGVKLAKATEPTKDEDGVAKPSIKTEDAKMEESATKTSDGSAEQDFKALRQIEFYFSDANLPYDKFMWTLHTKNEDHWVPLNTIVGFKRMQEYKPLGLPRLANLIRSSTLGLLEMDAEGVNVRRIAKLIPPSVSGQFERSVYAKGFGEEKPGLQKQLETFFEKWGAINAVRMRRKDKKRDGSTEFKGSAFCEYKTLEAAEAFVAAEPKPKWGDTELLIMSKNTYVTMKSKEKGFTVPDRSTVLVGNKSRSFNAFKLMEEEARSKSGKPSGGTAETEKEEEAAKTVTVDGKQFKIREDGTVDPEDLSSVSKGKVLKWTGAGEGKDPYFNIKKALQDAFPKAPFIKAGEDGMGFAGFTTVLTDEQVETVQTKVPQILGKDVTWEKLSDEEELQYWSNRANELAQKVLDGPPQGGKSSSQRGGRGGRPGGRGRGAGRGRGGRSDHNPRGNNKRKRDDGAANEGDGASSAAKGAVPAITSAKKARVDTEL